MSIKVMILAAFLFAFTFAGPAVASEDDADMRFMQGVINSVGSTSFVLNEGQRVNIAAATEYFDSHGRPSGIKVIAEGGWLYVEGVVERDGSITAEKVYALPGYISKKKRSKYSFMQLP